MEDKPPEIEHTEKNSDKVEEDKTEEGGDSDEYEDVEFKMVFVVNTELDMGVGKIAAQVAHGALGLYRELASQPDHLVDLSMWQEIGEKKIVLKGDNTKHLLELGNICQALNIPCVTIRDAGHTQVLPGSHTVLAIFGSSEEVDQITGKLKLL